MDAIYDCLKNCAVLAANAGGCGISIQNIRVQGSFIQGSNGTSSGIVPLLQVYNNTTRYVDQGGKVWFVIWKRWECLFRSQVFQRWVWNYVQCLVNLFPDLDPDIGPRKRSTLNQSPYFQCILSHPLTFHLHFSCFLLTMTDDSIDGIYDTLKQCAMISKSAGGEHVYVAW